MPNQYQNPYPIPTYDHSTSIRLQEQLKNNEKLWLKSLCIFQIINSFSQNGFIINIWDIWMPVQEEMGKIIYVKFITIENLVYAGEKSNTMVGIEGAN